MERARGLIVLCALAAVLAPAQAGAQVRFHGEAGGPYAVKVMSWKDIPFRTVVRQHYDYSCGSAALATLLHHHYGEPVGEADLFKAMWSAGDQAKIRKVGFSLLDMKRALAARGYKADGYRLTLDQLDAVQTPAIALITIGRYRHFVVVKGVDKERVLVGDPALGLKVYSRGDFQKIWNGIAFVIHGHSGNRPQFDRVAEWRPWSTAPLGRPTPLADDSLAAFSRELPPLYQISKQFDLTPIFE
jgi:hypothetical protein